MNRSLKATISLFLSAVLAFSTLPASSFAQMGEESMGEERIGEAEDPAKDSAGDSAGNVVTEPVKELGSGGDSLQSQSNELGEESFAPDATANDELAPEGEDELGALSDGFGGQLLPESESDNVNCKFTLDSNGYLVVGPQTGTSCVLSAIPSNVLLQYLYSMKGLRFEKGVKAHENFNLFRVCTDVVMVNDGNGGERAVAIFPYLEELNFTNLDLSSMRSTQGAFAGLRTKGKLELSMDTSRVTNMSFMFFGFQGSLHHTDYDTSNVTNMLEMFYASNFVDLKVGFTNTSNVTDMRWMFGNMKSLKELDISCMNNANANCENMFANTSGINKIVVGSGWDTSKSGAFPDSPSGRWWSQGAKKWMTVKEIASQRRNVADTYTSYERFPDVLGNTWFADVVSRAASMGIIGGYSDGNFGPNDPITRGQVAVMLWKMAGQPAGARDFPDVREGDYFYQAVRWAGSVGVVSGYANGNFGPNDKVTREQLAVMLANYARHKTGRQLSGSPPDYGSMSDAGSVSTWAQSSVGWCCRHGILNGSGGQLRPQGNASRAEAAKMVVFLSDVLG